MDYKINVNRLKDNENSNIKGFASVVFGESFKVSSIAIMEGKNGLYVQMPRYKSNDIDEEGRNVYKDFYNPITKEFRQKLYDAILKQYQEAKKEQDKVVKEEQKKSSSKKKASEAKDKAGGR